MEHPNKYQSGKIYKIIDVGYTKCYIGSTTEKLSSRMAKHRYTFSTSKDNTASCLLFREFGIENCKIELIELYPCQSKEELYAREGFHIRTMECVNKIVAGRTQKEKYEENKQEILQKMKLYRDEHKEEIRERKRLDYLNHKAYIQEKRRETYICPVCEICLIKANKSSHEKTKRHLANSFTG